MKLLPIFIIAFALAQASHAEKAKAPLNSPDAFALRDDLFALNKIATGFFINNYCNQLSDSEIGQLEDDLNAINLYLHNELGSNGHSLSAIQRTAYRHADDLVLKGCDDSNNIELIKSAKINARLWVERLD